MKTNKKEPKKKPLRKANRPAKRAGYEAPGDAVQLRESWWPDPCLQSALAVTSKADRTAAEKDREGDAQRDQNAGNAPASPSPTSHSGSGNL